MGFITHSSKLINRFRESEIELPETKFFCQTKKIDFRAELKLEIDVLEFYTFKMIDKSNYCLIFLKSSYNLLKLKGCKVRIQ